MYQLGLMVNLGIINNYDIIVLKYLAWAKTMTSSPKVTLHRKKKIEYLVDDIHEL